MAAFGTRRLHSVHGGARGGASVAPRRRARGIGGRPPIEPVQVGPELTVLLPKGEGGPCHGQLRLFKLRKLIIGRGLCLSRVSGTAVAPRLELV